MGRSLMLAFACAAIIWVGLWYQERWFPIYTPAADAGAFVDCYYVYGPRLYRLTLPACPMDPGGDLRQLAEVVFP